MKTLPKITSPSGAILYHTLAHLHHAAQAQRLQTALNQAKPIISAVRQLQADNASLRTDLRIAHRAIRRRNGALLAIILFCAAVVTFITTTTILNSH